MTGLFAKSARAVTFSLLLVVLLTLGMVIETAAADAAADSAAPGSQGTVVTEVLNVRAGAGTLNVVVGKVYQGDNVIILGSEKDYTGTIWYQISFSGGTGYVSSDYVNINSDNEYVYDADFEKELSNQGFPESYKPYLRQLHADCPNWIFESQQTGLDWSAAVAKECKPGKTLVTGSAPSSWKSTEEGAYNPETGTYIIYDSGNWVTASKAIIEYYMDPRNFLNKTGIFQFLSHSYDGRTQTAEGLWGVLKGTFMGGSFPEAGYESYNQVLMEVGQQTGVNPYVLASMILVEQGSTGIGKSISGTVSGYEGFYNHFNVGAYAAGGMDAVTRGLWYASGSGSYSRPWDSVYKSIYGGASYYSQNYVHANQDTLYLKKFNVMNGLEKVAEGQYMTNVQGAENEALALRKGYQEVMNGAMTFRIPVFENMPSAACLKPINASNSKNDNKDDKEQPEEKPTDDTDEKITANVKAITLKLSSALTDQSEISLSWSRSEGEAVDYYQVFRSLKRYSGFGTKAYYTTKNVAETTWTDKAVSMGTTYYYKVRGVRNVGGKTVVTQWSTKSWRTVKSAAKPAEPEKPSEPENPGAFDDPEDTGGSGGSTGNIDDTKEKNEALRLGIKNTIIKISSSMTEKGKIRLDWSKSSDYDVDYYEIYRSTERYSGFGKKPYYTTSSGKKTFYVNTKGLEAGKTYYYKIRGIRMVDGKAVYTQYSAKSWRTIKG